MFCAVCHCCIASLLLVPVACLRRPPSVALGLCEELGRRSHHSVIAPQRRGSAAKHPPTFFDFDLDSERLLPAFQHNRTRGTSRPLFFPFSPSSPLLSLFSFVFCSVNGFLTRVAGIPISRYESSRNVPRLASDFLSNFLGPSAHHVSPLSADPNTGTQESSAIELRRVR